MIINLVFASAKKKSAEHTYAKSKPILERVSFRTTDNATKLYAVNTDSVT